MPIRILIADDHAVVRSGLRALLRSDPELEVVGEAGDGVETLHLAETLRPDLVLLDITMPPESAYVHNYYNIYYYYFSYYYSV
mgnify:CR=1 FL=1